MFFCHNRNLFSLYLEILFDNISILLNGYPKIFWVAESKSNNVIAKFKMADPIWQMKSLKIIVFL